MKQTEEVGLHSFETLVALRFRLALVWQAAWRLWWLLGVPASMCEDAMVTFLH